MSANLEIPSLDRKHGLKWFETTYTLTPSKSKVLFLSWVDVLPIVEKGDSKCPSNRRMILVKNLIRFRQLVENNPNQMSPLDFADKFQVLAMIDFCILLKQDMCITVYTADFHEAFNEVENLKG
jgi:hypothetical protein